MKVVSYLLFCALLVSSAVAGGDFVSLTSKDGKTIQVELKHSTEKKVTFVMVDNKRKYTFKLDKLDAASQEKIRDWKKAGGGASVSFDIDFVSGKSSRAASRYEYDDERRVVIKPKITVSNKDKDARTKPVEITVLILGRPVKDRSSIHVLGRESHPLASIEALGEKEIQMKTIVSAYDNRDSYRYGSMYSGYVVLIHEGKKILASKSVPTPNAEKWGAVWLGLKVDCKYDKNLKPISYPNVIR